MTQREFDRFLSGVKGLSTAQMQLLRHELDRELAHSGAHAVPAQASETAFDVLNQAGVIGRIKGSPRAPNDLSTNSRHMEGFGRE
jgi:hypothetical protein